LKDAGKSIWNLSLLSKMVDNTIDLARTLRQEQFPVWEDLPTSLIAESGNDNRAFHLGETMSIRLFSAERYALQVDKEWRWLPPLAANLRTPIPLPLAKGAASSTYPW